jgi:putative transposase
VSEATVYRLLKDHGLITSPAFILMKAADRFANPTTAPNQLWQTDFTYLKVIGCLVRKLRAEHGGGNL